MLHRRQSFFPEESAGIIISKMKSIFVFQSQILDIILYIEILEFYLSDMNKIIKKLNILQFDSNPKYLFLKTFDFYKDNSI